MKKIKPINEEELKIPAYMRKRSITSHSRQKLLLTALDRKDAGVKPNSSRATAPIKQRVISPQPVRTTTSPASTKTALPLTPKKLMQVGEVTHYMNNIDVAIILLNQKGVKKGDILLIEGPDFIATQPVEEMQIDRKPVIKAKKGDHIGLKVQFEAEVGGKVFKLN